MIKTEKRVGSCRNAALAIPAMQTDGHPEFCARNFLISLVRILRLARRKPRKKNGRFDRRRFQHSLHERNEYEMQYHSPVHCSDRSSPEVFVHSSRPSDVSQASTRATLTASSRSYTIQIAMMSVLREKCCLLNYREPNLVYGRRASVSAILPHVLTVIYCMQWHVHTPPGC